MIGMRILVAEDTELDAFLLIKILESLGHEAVWQNDGRKALAAMVDHACPVVISDWMMPGTDGISLCRSIRELKTPFYVYFILLTAKISQGEGCKVLANGVDAFLPKPVIRETLRAKLNVASSTLRDFQRQLAG